VPDALRFEDIRAWDGSQDRAFEELCYQLRDPVPETAQLFKVGNPDGGYEWFVRHRNGVEWGWQVKYSKNIDSLIGLMEDSLKAVVDKRPRCTRLTFCIPFDLPDSPDTRRQRKSARKKFEDWKVAVRPRVEGADKVKIELLQAGDLLERLATPANRGRIWFFWDREAFGREWCRERFEVAKKAAGRRYSATLNVELPVAFALEGLGRSELFIEQYTQRRKDLLRSLRRVRPSEYSAWFSQDDITALSQALATVADELPTKSLHEAAFPQTQLAAVARNVEARMSAVVPSHAVHGHTTDADSARAKLVPGIARASALGEFLTSPASRAAETGTLLLTGAAGQGKTHLFCDAVERALDSDRLAVVLLGQQFRGTNVFDDLAARLGLPNRGASELLGAMAAAGEAADRPFVILIDALNDSADAAAWKTELPSLLAEVANYAPWIVVGVSVRSTYVDLVLGDHISELPQVEHPGFDQFEVEAVHRFSAAYGLEEPRIPLLLPEFINPLFLRLYSEGVAASGAAPKQLGHAHITEVFEQYLATKNAQVSQQLNLDPTAGVLQSAVASFASEVADRSREWLPREAGRRVVDAQASHLTSWPDTLFGQLLAEGILTEDLGYERSDDGELTLVPGVQITFQRLADYRIADAMLASVATPAELRTALRAGEPLRKQITRARTGVIEALAVLLPERFGIELLQAARWGNAPQLNRWRAATLDSIATRRDDAVTERTRELFRAISRASRPLFDHATQILVTVAARPNHPLNAEFLHRALSKLSMADRDASWGLLTYWWIDEPGPLDRLVRWAAAGPYPEYAENVLELATLPLIWTLGSPNRVMRDYVTKALARLLPQRLGLLARLLERFREVNDPYVLERIAVISHGAILLNGATDPEGTLACSRLLLQIALADDTIPDISLRDAARGAMEWCLSRGLIDEDEYRTALPPYGSSPPETPRTEKQLEKAFRPYDRIEDRPGYANIWLSVFGFGDFGRYVIESDVRHFTRYRLSRKLPSEYKPDPERLAAFVTSLNTKERAAYESRDPVAMLEEFSDARFKQLDAVERPRRTDRGYPSQVARSWVVERVVSLGWTPERFGDFDRRIAYTGAGRSGHKPERFGKKYQWIALRELLARIADNFHSAEVDEDRVPRAYQGPWEFFGRHIDPCLPPAVRARDRDGVQQFGPSFLADSDSWWVPEGPSYTPDQPTPKAGWAQKRNDIPSVRALMLRTDADGESWIPLRGYYAWVDEPDDDTPSDRPRRELWSHIYSWLISADRTDDLYRFLTTRSLMERWMPEGIESTDSGYLGEVSWAQAANEYPQRWAKIDDWHNQDSTTLDGLIYPAWHEYRWEGVVWDCSIDDSVAGITAAKDLYRAGGLTWKPGTRDWVDAGGDTVAIYRENRDERMRAFLVRQDWLVRTLAEQHWGLVLGWLGEKQLIGRGFSPELIGGWSEINGVARVADGQWKYGNRRIAAKQVHH
jgi:hypothetical protein